MSAPAAAYRPWNPQFSDYYWRVEDHFEVFVQISTFPYITASFLLSTNHPPQRGCVITIRYHRCHLLENYYICNMNLHVLLCKGLGLKDT
jgi:hypothetical protein